MRKSAPRNRSGATLLIGFVAAICLGGTAQAGSETSTSAADSKTSAQITPLIRQKQFEDSHTLTDAKLRADDGSLSHYSMKGNLSYYGPTLGDWSAPDQPNPDAAIGNYSQAIKGSVMARYRMDSDSTISAGTGISFNHPFHGLDRTDANNPFLSMDFARRFWGIQMRNSPGLTIATVPNYLVVGEVGGVSFDNSLIYNLGDTRFAIGVDTGLSYWIYSRSYRSGAVKTGGDGLAQQYTISTNPVVKYNVSDSFSVSASLGFQLYNPRALNDDTALWNRSATAKLGFAYALGRAVYLAPYLQTYLGHLTADATSLNVSTIFSLL